MNEPLVGIVVPVYNGADYLAECLASIQAQTYTHWRAVVVDNCSEDGTGAIAEGFARGDNRFRVLHCTEFLDQARNYNRAVAAAPEGSRYIKLVEADNWIIPDCVRSMVNVAESDPQVGLVGAYYLKGADVMGSGLPYEVSVLPGPDVCRMHLLQKVYFFGTPTTLLFRVEALAEFSACFQPGLFYDDVDLCFRILRRWKFGFAHQVLAFVRVENQGLMSRYQDLDFVPARQRVLTEHYGAGCLTADELRRLRQDTEREYLRRLGHALLTRRNRDYWEFHRGIFRLLGRELRWVALWRPAATAFLDLLLEPKRTWARVAARLGHRSEHSTGSAGISVGKGQPHVSVLPAEPARNRLG